ncbi:hypothetical protein P170DRAFT_435357 [Aspergillus steynii IBT 23096]|uniref:Sulfotransferase family protein n=1 Tax=Aspergillus steynii IBT 23096 TaxID=1392250 RepID=A0A2I2GBA9_9EURO|nr:uncharacterized protein P170DRAFT_435357 [Aspergillus steynii IBT 23096]PLB50168.1 hypothetical protein P170DRAFT_435357 [Aspergillus steynii IBT 23096]
MAPARIPPRRVLLVSNPRTASNLLLKILALPDQPNVYANEKGGYYFFNSFVATANNNRIYKPFEQWTSDDRSEVQSALKTCFDQLEESTSHASQESKVFFAKEHSPWFIDPIALQKILRLNDNTASEDGDAAGADSPFRQQVPSTYTSSPTFSPSNYTILPDEYLRTFHMAFIVRHPALMFPSFYRAMCKMVKLGVITQEDIGGVMVANMTLRFSRLLYDWCLEQDDPDARPVILDAYEVIHKPEAVVRFCEMTGLDANAIKFEWENKPGSKDVGAQNVQMDGNTEQRTLWSPEAASVMVSTLTGSSGVVKSKAPDVVDIAVEAAKWKEEFGQETADMLEKRVRNAMPDYEYLKARSVTASA